MGMLRKRIEVFEHGTIRLGQEFIADDKVVKLEAAH